MMSHVEAELEAQELMMSKVLVKEGEVGEGLETSAVV